MTAPHYLRDPIGALRRLGIKTIGTALVVVLTIVVAGIAATSLTTLKEAERMAATWQAFDKGAAAKSDILGDLRGALGYGGVIHQFKNFILRQDRARIVGIQARLLDVSVALTAYAAHDITPRERGALAAIDATLARYMDAVAVAERMVAEGAASQDIDRAVRIDDAAALKALEVLETELRTARSASAQAVYGSVARVKRIVFVAIAASGVLIGFLIVSTLWFFRARLVRPLMRLAATMEKLAAGNYTVEVPERERGDEIGAIAATVQAFKTSAIEHRQVRIALAESETRFRDFAGAASDFFWEMDAELCFSYVSERFEKVTGMAPKKLLGRTWEEMPVPDVEQDVWRTHLDDLAAHRPFRDFRHSRVKPDGETVWLSINGTPVFDEDGAFAGYRGTGTDITAVVEATHAQRRAAAEAVAASRAKSEFLANMSHELRTPLNAVIGFSEMILAETFGPIGNPRYEDYIRDIHTSGAHLLSLINDILDLSKIEAGKFELDKEDIRLEDELGRCLDLMRARSIEKDVALELDLVGDICGLWADRRALRQILLNLLSNAVKFTPAGGRITVTAGPVADGSPEIAVTDTGIGMTPGDIEKALTPFAQVETALNRKYDGTGLGLPLAKSMVELHGGSLDIDSAPGTGTTVTLRFPARVAA